MISTRNATYEPRNTKLLWYALIWAVIHIPFIAVSLFFGYRDTSCVHLFSSYVELSLGIWLRTDAYIMLIFMITLIILGYLSIRYHGWKCPYLVWQFVHVIYSLWRCAWLIVGSIMFWL